MSTPQIRETRNFGTRNTSGFIKIARNGKSRQYNINPTIFSLGAGFLGLSLVGYFCATAYLVFRDDLIGAQIAREARMKHEYEDRLASLRTKLDRVTSRQLLDQRAIEKKVAALMERQSVLDGRDGTLAKLVSKARKQGITLSQNGAAAAKAVEAVPSGRPTSQNVQLLGTKGIDTSFTGSTIQPSRSKGEIQASLGFGLGGDKRNAPAPQHTLAFNAASPAQSDHLFVDVSSAIGVIDQSQRELVQDLHEQAAARTKKIAKTLKSLGVRLPKLADTQVGGPYIPLAEETDFEDQVSELDHSLAMLDKLSARAKILPIANPAPGKALSSRFGARKDPFNGRRAMHSGLDFRARTGDKVLATASGKVLRAGRVGGYGNLVEIEHANGYVTRYGHLSRIKVKAGQKVRRGALIGLVGSTGRSTGPHLHYEVRRKGKATDPLPFIRAGKKIGKLL